MTLTEAIQPELKVDVTLTATEETRVIEQLEFAEYMTNSILEQKVFSECVRAVKLGEINEEVIEFMITFTESVSVKYQEKGFMGDADVFADLYVKFCGAEHELTKVKIERG